MMLRASIELMWSMESVADNRLAINFHHKLATLIYPKTHDDRFRIVAFINVPWTNEIFVQLDGCEFKWTNQLAYSTDFLINFRMLA